MDFIELYKRMPPKQAEHVLREKMKQLDQIKTQYQLWNAHLQDALNMQAVLSAARPEIWKQVLASK